MIFAACLLLVALCRESVALTCICDDCANSQTCEVGDGGRCYIQVVSYQQTTMVRRRCYENPATVQLLCGTNSNQVQIHCCDSDHCNAHLPPPDPPEPTSTPVHPGPEFRCVRNTINNNNNQSYCTTRHSCYWKIRRKSSGLLQFTQGCSSAESPCKPDERNRQGVFCCNSELCNDVQAPTKWPPSPKSSATTELSIEPTTASMLGSGDTSTSVIIRATSVPPPIDSTPSNCPPPKVITVTITATVEGVCSQSPPLPSPPTPQYSLYIAVVIAVIMLGSTIIFVVICLICYKRKGQNS